MSKITKMLFDLWTLTYWPLNWQVGKWQIHYAHLFHRVSVLKWLIRYGSMPIGDSSIASSDSISSKTGDVTKLWNACYIVSFYVIGLIFHPLNYVYWIQWDFECEKNNFIGCNMGILFFLRILKIYTTNNGLCLLGSSTQS